MHGKSRRVNAAVPVIVHKRLVLSDVAPLYRPKPKYYKRRSTVNHVSAEERGPGWEVPLLACNAVHSGRRLNWA